MVRLLQGILYVVGVPDPDHGANPILDASKDRIGNKITNHCCLVPVEL